MKQIDRIRRLEHELFNMTEEESHKFSEDFFTAVAMLDGIKEGIKAVKEGKIRSWEDIKKELKL